MTASLNIHTQPIEKKKLSVRKLHSITKNTFKAVFNESAIDLTLPVDTVLDQLNDELHKALDTIAPLKLIQVAPHQKQPWFNEIVKARHKVVQNREHGYGTSTLHLKPGRPIRLKEMYIIDFSSIRRDSSSLSKLWILRATTKSYTN